MNISFKYCMLEIDYDSKYNKNWNKNSMWVQKQCWNLLKGKWAENEQQPSFTQRPLKP